MAETPTKTQQPSAHLTVETTLSPAIKAWKIYMDDQGLSPHTIKAFSADVRLLAKYLPPDRPIGSISTQDLNNFLEWVENGRGKGIPCSPKTLARRITSIKSFFRWLHKGGVLLSDPAEKVVQKTVKSPLPEVLNPDEIEAALAVAHKYRQPENLDTRYYLLFTLLLHTGIKKSECLNLGINHIDLESGAGPLIFVRYASPSHRYKERKISVPEMWVEAFHEYTAQYEPTEELLPWSPRRLEYLLEDIGDEAGLEKHISFAMCRWTSALHDMRAGVEGNKIRQKLGISKIQWREVKSKLKKLDKKVPQPIPEQEAHVPPRAL